MPQPTLTLMIPATDVAMVTKVMNLISWDYLPADSLVFLPEDQAYQLDVDGERVTHLLELIELGADSFEGECFSERMVRLGKQHELPFDADLEAALDRTVRSPGSH
mgnify:CR=1 FL=1